MFGVPSSSPQPLHVLPSCEADVLGRRELEVNKKTSFRNPSGSEDTGFQPDEKEAV